MAEDAFKNRLAERCYMKMQAILPPSKAIIKYSGFEVIFSYWCQGHCSDTK